MRRVAVRILLAAVLAVAATGAPAETVRVGGYAFPPYVDDHLADGGVTQALLRELNALQDAHSFTFVPTSARRRYRDFRRGRFDVMLFESPRWGWRERGIAFDTVRPIVTDGEVLVAAADRVDSQAWFAEVADKTIAAHIGYHYAFADMESDPDRLRQAFDIRLSTSHRENVAKVLDGRVDVAVVTISFLELMFDERPALEAKLAVSRHPDQMYRLGALVRPGGPIGAAALTRLLDRAERTGRMEAVLARFGLAGKMVF
ncbi:amino acid ABC transporter substrate-binding protein, PAAT family [Limimonas halophila]|uniref:Amino acid ABC transporter substrate-binding protein, PAAT family n=1 Tax=Limimonas halophila TaxID=1082479 RepID=A0A1G7SZQ8_9PROT|nr:transporter substrate-binding domain-containing protein [Limimonas halophila]SDG28448.1 amino acid ABC transporter substrate-binding protein, PAAT family [Limimonas halophila]